MRMEACDRAVVELVRVYAARLSLPTECLWVTSDRGTYGGWLGRHIPSRYGGAYCFLRTDQSHRILINLERIDRSQPRAIEVVVAEELVHMRDHLDGDRRRHSHHGYDRIAHRVSALVGVPLEEVRSALLPLVRRPLRYRFECPACGTKVYRRRKGTWSCGRCSPVFDRRFILKLVADEGAGRVSQH
jgi:predicted SprT family Zn-dependent metalloprotease